MFAIMCPRCHQRDRSCTLCEGSGLRWLHRCPRAMATPDAFGALELHSLLEHGILPVAGAGLDEQPAAWWEQNRIIDSELALIRRELAANREGK